MTANPAALFYMLFEGHPDRYGTEEGGAVQDDAYEAVCRHFFKGIPCGIYPMREDGTVRWGCSDLDDTEVAYSEARAVQTILEKMNVTSWVEVSRSKGYHLWVFAEEFVPAATMRRCLLFAHEKAGVPAREVNPKQEKPGPKGFGNYVRLPYVHGGPDVNGRRVVLDDSGDPVDVMDFVPMAVNMLNQRTHLQRYADKYLPPAPTLAHTYRPTAVSPPLLRRLNGYAHKMLTEGLAEWRDRSGALVRLAHEAKKSGLSPDETKAIVLYADDQWGKYVGRANRDEIIEGIVSDAHR